MNNLEGLYKEVGLKEIKEIDYISKENLKDINKPIVEQIESFKNNIELVEIGEAVEGNIEKDQESYDLNKPILEQIETFQGDIDALEKNEELETYKNELQGDTGWSDEIIESISSIEEGEHYRNLELKEEEINGKRCLVKENIDLDTPVDPQGRTNKERMKEGLSPIDTNGDKIELHHMGQKSDGPLVELNTGEHRSKGIDSILHDGLKESEIDRNEFSKEKEEHWKTRAE